MCKKGVTQLDESEREVCARLRVSRSCVGCNCGPRKACTPEHCACALDGVQCQVRVRGMLRGSRIHSTVIRSRCECVSVAQQLYDLLPLAHLSSAIPYCWWLCIPMMSTVELRSFSGNQHHGRLPLFPFYLLYFLPPPPRWIEPLFPARARYKRATTRMEGPSSNMSMFVPTSAMCWTE